MPAPHHSVFTGRMFFLTTNQQCQRTEGAVHNTEKSENETAEAIMNYSIEFQMLPKRHPISTYPPLDLL